MVHSFEIQEFVENKKGAGVSYFRLWLQSLPVETQARIQVRILRLERGNLGDVKNVGEGVLEARMTFGPGYRLYFGIERQKIILLLWGGDKSTQEKDIRKAKEFWSIYTGEQL